MKYYRIAHKGPYLCQISLTHDKNVSQGHFRLYVFHNYSHPCVSTRLDFPVLVSIKIRLNMKWTWNMKKMFTVYHRTCIKQKINRINNWTCWIMSCILFQLIDNSPHAVRTPTLKHVEKMFGFENVQLHLKLENMQTTGKVLFFADFIRYIIMHISIKDT